MEKVLGVYYYSAYSCLFRYNKLTKRLIGRGKPCVPL